MRINRFYLNLHLGDSQVDIVDPEIINQIQKVLRLKNGEQICLFNGDGNDYYYSISSIDKRVISAGLIRFEKNSAESIRDISLFCAVLKKENFELVAQKATEIGVRRIVPIITDNTVKLNLNLERLKKIIVEATEQSARNFVPKISDPIELQLAVRNLEQGNICLFCDFDGKQINEINLGNHEPINIFVGPEGGWSQFEKDLAHQKGFLKLSLGNSVLRGETAAIVASAFVVNKARK